MRLHKSAIDSYGAVQVQTGVATADSARLILMLFDGLLESLMVAKGHIQHGNIVAKSSALTRAGRIVVGLQGALDFERGGDISSNLSELYAYVTRRLLQANASNDTEIIDEVHGLMSEIREAWQSLPGLMPSQQPAPLLN
jgi:flagellar secretion chaperone FliS